VPHRGGVQGAYAGVLPHVLAGVSRSGRQTDNSRALQQFTSTVTLPSSSVHDYGYSTTPALTGSWAILNFSNLTGLSAAKSGLKASEFSQRSAQADVALATRRSFYEVVKAIKLYEVATSTVKLARALWIVPITLGTAFFKRKEARIQWPWFILFFVFAALANTYLPAQRSATQTFFTLGRFGLTATLFLIGTGISRKTLKEVGWRPLLQGVLLWVAVGLTSLYFIRIGLIAF
jgi:hypothetical protein